MWFCLALAGWWASRSTGLALARGLQIRRAIMDLTHQHLEPIFENIFDLLEGTPGQVAQFEPWAIDQAARLRNAATAGKASLRFEADLIRGELERMKVPASFTRMTTERTERMRLCQRMWLTGLLDFVDDLVAEPSSDEVPWSA
jgi:hypothetical protein